MATLDPEVRKNRKKRKYIICGIFIISSLLISPYLAAWIDSAFSNQFDGSKIQVEYLSSLKTLFTNKMQMSFFVCMEVVALLSCFLFLTNSQEKIGKSKVMKVTDKIEIPKAIGEGQHGTSRFLTKGEKRTLFYTYPYDGVTIRKETKNLGLVLGMEKENGKEVISCVVQDVHSIIIGSTRSGKTRRLIIETIWLRAHTGKSMIISDPKGELYLYTYPFLKQCGYEVIDLDFRQPRKSKKYNYMQHINDAVAAGDIPTAIDYTWDLTSVLVGVPKGEPLWTNGESAVIASAILAVAMDAPEEYKNMTNVYYFIANMCKANEIGEMPISRYFARLPDSHPAKGIFSVAEISPEKTRGSFFTSALATLRLFTNWNIADMTSASDFVPKNIGEKKTAVFMIIPDEKTTLYSLISLFVNQTYIQLVDLANHSGGRVPNEIDFILDEFGNLPSIPSFGSMLSVGAGRGLRFTLVVQDYQQLEKHYKQDHENIKGNCMVTVFLKTPTPKTLDEISKRTGTYTCQVNSVNSSVSGRHGYNSASFSDAANMQSRALLLPDEVSRIDQPYSLVLFTGEYPGIFQTPDLSQYIMNAELGLGDEKQNQKIVIQRDGKRKERGIAQLQLWGVWNKFKKKIEEPGTERISFLE